MKFRRNEPCPCGSGEKYKRCCLDKVEWDRIFSRGTTDELMKNLTARGKNRLFMSSVGDALGLNLLTATWEDVKRTCTPSAVRDIHLAVQDIWPDMDDLERTLVLERGRFSSLFTGSYDEVPTVLDSISRHSVYSDRILLFDPFLDHRWMKPEFSPVENPAEYRTATLRNLHLWFELAPWIDAGIVAFVRNPGDFDSSLRKEFMAAQQSKMASPEFESRLQDCIHKQVTAGSGDWMKEHLFLSAPDEYLKAIFRQMYPSGSESELAELLATVHRRRQTNPYFLPEMVGTDETYHQTTGASYPAARFTAALCGAHLATDLEFRWLEILEDRQKAGSQASSWEPFAVAFQQVEFRSLRNVPLDTALRLRKENRLSSMRSFLRKVWGASSEDGEASETTIQNLTDELRHEAELAAREWKGIDVDLARQFASTTVLAMAPAPSVDVVSAKVLAGAAVIAGLAELGSAAWKRKNFLNRYPAAFFLENRSQVL